MIIIYLVKEVLQLIDDIAYQLFKFVGTILALGVGLVVIGIGIETFSIDKTSQFISNLFSKDNKINNTS